MTSGAPAAVPCVSHETVFFHARKLPSAPQVLASLCELLQDVNVNLGASPEKAMEELFQQIDADPKLAAALFGAAQAADEAADGGD